MAVVYFHRRKDTNEVFYVGIGNNVKRAKSTSSRNQYWHNVVNKVGYYSEIVHRKLTWKEASKLETKYIRQFGRADLGLGILVNMTDGGDGNVNMSQECRDKIGRASKGRKVSSKIKEKYSIIFKGEGNPFYGKCHNEETKKKISEKNSGRTLSKEHIQSIIDANTGRIVSKKTRDKIGDLHRGKKLSEETKKKIGEANRGNTPSKESRKKMSQSRLGEKNHKSLITESDVIQIRQLHSEKKYTNKKLAELFGLSYGGLQKIIYRKTWKHI